MKNFFTFAFLLTLLNFAACTGSGTSSDYFAPGYAITPPTLVAAEGNVRGAIATIESYNFGTRTAATDATFTLHNNGELVANISDARFGGSDFSFVGGVFPGTGGTCGRAIRANDFCTIIVRYTPVTGTSVSSLMTIEYDSRDGMTALYVRLNAVGGSAPVISSISPTSGLPAGGATLTISGRGFVSGATVAVGGSACTSVSVVSSTQMTCVTPPHASGTVDVILTHSDGERALYGSGFNYRTAPILAAIGNQSVNENAAITQVDANDSGDDFDGDGEAIGYSCYYDTTVDGSVGVSTTCSSLSGVNFTTSSGVMDWTPSYSQSGSYEFKITGSDGSLSDAKIFSVTVSNVNRAPSLANISNQSVNENAAITQVNANDGGDDFDADSEAVTYTCYYDTSVDGAVAASTTCLSLTGASFAAATGVMDWTPSYSQSGSYEFKIAGSDGTLSDNKIFTVTVANVNRAPSIDAIADQSGTTGVAIAAINAADGGDDSDVDGDTITYTCYYDSTSDGSVANSTTCASLAGASFTGATGAFAWTPASAGTYEMKITGGDGALSDDEFFVVTVTAAGGWIETKLTASDGAASDQFGISVAISGSTALIGAHGDAGGTGSAYLYQFDPSSNTWNETKLTASDGGVNDDFGISVAISGSTALIGASGDVSQTGSAYFYQFDPSSNTWNETKLTASDGAASDYFGMSVAISGSTALIGAHGDGGWIGSAYLYQFDPSSNTWNETKLTASDAGLGDQFGMSVAISGSAALIGAHGDASYTGSAYVYQFDPSSNTWHETKLTASDGAVDDHFGISVAISGSTALIGAHGDASNTGSAYLYQFDPSSNTWNETKLTASDGVANDYFGDNVAISGSTAVVGNGRYQYMFLNTGAVYLYDWDPSSLNWRETKLRPSDAVTGDQGYSVAISGSTLIAGALGDDSSRGSAYIYKRTLPASETKLTASDGAGGDFFGYSVAISETTAIVGAHGDASSTGSAYVLQFDPSSNTWNETKLTASDGAVNDYFGVSVAISGTTAIVGSQGDGGYTGSAYVYRFDPSSNTWNETKLTASDGAVLDCFGYSVAISGTSAIVGAYRDASFTGSAYVFRFDPSSNTWNETKLTASDGAVNDRFGYSVAISGTTAIVGAFWDASGIGSAYVFRFDPSSNTWNETKLTASDGAVNDYFGVNVAISGTTAIVGAHGDASSTGGAYIFRFDPSSNTWNETKLTASDGAVLDCFGYSVAISATSAIVGAHGDASYTGGAYIFRFDPSSNAWNETKLTASDGAVNDNFGQSVAISGTTAIVGASWDASNTGSAYLYGF